MMSSDQSSSAQQMANAAALQNPQFTAASSMYYINDPQSQAAQAMLSVDPQGIPQMDPTGMVPQSLDYHQQQKLASQMFNSVGHFGDDEDDTTVDQQMILDGRAMVPPIVDEVNARSVFVGNVDYGTTPGELQEHFKNCGPMNRITIMIDKETGHPKGYAYIEFQDESAMPHAVSLNQSIFRDRPLKVIPKRKNMPGFSRGRNVIGRGSAAAAAAAALANYPAFMRGKLRGRGRGFVGYLPRYRGRGRGGGIYPY